MMKSCLLLTKRQEALITLGGRLFRWQLPERSIEHLDRIIAVVAVFLQPVDQGPQINDTLARQYAVAITVAQFARLITHIVEMNMFDQRHNLGCEMLKLCRRRIVVRGIKENAKLRM